MLENEADWRKQGIETKLFPCRFNLSKHLKSPIESGTSCRLQKLRSRKIKNFKWDEYACLGSRSLRFKQLNKSRVLRDTKELISFGILTSFSHFLKLKKVRLERTPIDSWIVDKLEHPSMSRYLRCVALVKFGVLLSLEQPERCRTLRELM